MPPAPLHAVCSEAAIAPSTIWYRVCTKHGTSLASFLAAGEDRTILPQHTIYKTTEQRRQANDLEDYILQTMEVHESRTA